MPVHPFPVQRRPGRSRACGTDQEFDFSGKCFISWAAATQAI
jgi:hypothetical protein